MLKCTTDNKTLQNNKHKQDMSVHVNTLAVSEYYKLLACKLCTLSLY